MALVAESMAHATPFVLARRFRAPQAVHKAAMSSNNGRSISAKSGTLAHGRTSHTTQRTASGDVSQSLSGRASSDGGSAQELGIAMRRYGDPHADVPGTCTTTDGGTRM